MFKNKTQITRQGYLILTRRPVRNFTLIFVGFLILAFGCLGFVNLAANPEFSIMLWSVGGVVAIVLAFFIPILMKSQMLKTAEKNTLADFNVFNIFEFEGDFIFITSTRFEETFAKAKLSYSDLKVANQHGHFLTLGVHSGQFYILDLNFMTEGTSDGLIGFLKSKIGENNFKTYKK